MYNDSDRVVEFPALKEAQEKLDAKRKGLADILGEAGPELDMAKVKSIQGDTRAKVDAIGALNKELDELKKDVDDKLTVARAAAAAMREEKAAESGDGAAERELERKGRRRRFNLGEAFGESAAFKSYTPGSGAGPSAHLDVDLKTLMQTGNIAGAGWDPEDIRTGRLELTPQRPAVHVANYFPQTTTTMSSVVYMEETTFASVDGAAAATADGLASLTNEAGTYGEAQLALTERQEPVRKIAVWLPVTDEQFEDEPRARDYVNNRLPYMVQAKLDSQLLQGSGTAPQMKGVENVSGIQTQALGSDSIPDAVYKAARKIRDSGFAEPNVIFIAPAKWESVRLLKTADGQYIWGHPSMVGPATLWGIPVVETTAVTSTKAILGDFANYAELAMKRGLDVQVTNSHGTLFVEGKLAIRADLRACAVFYRPSAFASVTGL
jgi:HK97 family phage major capsid protein